MAESHPFRRAAEAKDLEQMREALSEDVVLHSPVLFRGFEGREVVLAVLSHVIAVLEDFAYVDEIGEADRVVLRFRAGSATASSRASTTSSSTPTAASPS